MKKQLPGWAVLLIITLVAGIALGITDALTRNPIAEQERIQAENARKSVLKDAVSFEQLSIVEDASVAWAYAGIGEDGQPIGYVAQKTIKGFGGDVDVIVGVNVQDPENLTLTGISVGGSKFKETAGLGARSKDKAFTDQFIGKSVPLKLIKNSADKADNTIDAITSATVTSNAVVNGVNDVVKFVKSDILGIAGIEMPERPADAQVFGASAKGKQGPVYVEAAFDANDAITYISVGNEEYKEDMDGGAREADFLIQFIGKKAPVDIADVDTITGSTVTSTAVVNALNQAYELSQGREIAIPETPVLPEKPTDAQVFGASAQGKQGPVYVEAAFDADDAITYISVGNEEYKEDMDGGAREADFLIQFIGKKAPVDIADVDTITGSTVTSTAVVNALNQAYELSKGREIAVPETPVIPDDAVSAEIYAGGSTLKVFITAEDGKLAYLHVEEKAYGASAFAACAQEEALQSRFVGSSLPLSVDENDLYAFCTAVAVNKAYSAIAPAESKDAAEGRTASAEAMAGSSTVRVSITEKDGVLTGLSVQEKAEGASAFADTDRGAALQKLVGKTLPVSVEESDPFAFAAAVAVNKAYAQIAPEQQPETADTKTEATAPAQTAAPSSEPVETKPTEAVPAEPVPTAAPVQDEKTSPSPDGADLAGESLVFFTAVKADVAFQDDRIISVDLSGAQPGGDYAPLDHADAFSALLIGKTAPVDAADLRVSGVPDYVSAAVALAVNDAYGMARPAEETLPASNENQPAESAFTASGSALVFFTSVKADVNIQDGVITEAALSSARVGGEYAPMAQAEQFSALLKGMKAPVSANDLRVTGVPDYVSAAVALAVNDACGKSQPAAEELPETKEEQPAAESTSSGSSLIFFTAIRTEAAFEGSTLSDFTLESSAAGQNAWEPMDQEQAYLEALIGKTMPLSDSDVHVAGDAQDRAVQIALNEAYAAKDGTKTDASVEAPEQTSLEKKAYTGECVIFFERVIAQAAFEDGRAVSVSVLRSGISEDPSEGSWISWTALEGEPLPLDPSAYIFDSVEDYVGKAIVIAVNQAYEQSLAGQQ